MKANKSFFSDLLRHIRKEFPRFDALELMEEPEPGFIRAKVTKPLTGDQVGSIDWFCTVARVNWLLNPDYGQTVFSFFAQDYNPTETAARIDPHQN